MDLPAYLARSGVPGGIAPSYESLERLRRAHLTSVPFENLHVFHRRGVRTDADWSVGKSVSAGRGGWCHELNGAFAALLETLGFYVTRLGATVLLDPELSPTPDHFAVEVALDRPYLVDVGFGDSFIRPLPLDSEGPHDGGIGDVGFANDGDSTTLISHRPNGTIEDQYRFGPEPHVTSDFDPASTRLQTDPEHQWTKRLFATRLVAGGPDHVTLLHNRIKFRRNGEWTEEPVTREEWPSLLRRWFSMQP